MKRHGNLFHRIIAIDNIYMAYRKARKGKKCRRSIKRIEDNLSYYLQNIQKMLRTKEFITSAYRLKEIYEPKQRTIYILPFYPDHIVQHALLQIVSPIWDNLMISDSYACRIGKGVHKASTKTMLFIKRYKYCLKGDISKFYPSVDHNILLNIIKIKIKCQDTLWLIKNIINSFPGNLNIPIGNYTSQWFGNLYLNELDVQVKQTYQQKAYIRYCDDFVLFNNDKVYLQYLKNKIQEFIYNNLKLKFSKWSIFPVVQGVDFLGYRHFPTKILLGKSTAKRVKRRLANLPNLLNSGKISTEQFRSSIASTYGWLKWANTYNFKINLQLNKLMEVS